MATVHQGDVIIQVRAGTSLQLVDAVTRGQIGIAASLSEALELAADQKGAVWRENVDHYGRPLGAPILILPKMSQ
jgi:hypothetical protein